MNEKSNITHQNCSTLVLRLALNALLNLLHAHRVLPKDILSSRQNLFAIRTRDTSSVRKFATARACAKERGLPRRALVSSQDKSCSVALLGLAFTMAEILLSLTIIGVVAAITLPSLMANINERTWNTQRKALYARMSQAIAMMPQVGGYGTLTEDESGSVTADTAAETFLTEGLSKVLKINNICDSEHLADCGVPTSYTNLAGSTKTCPTTIGEWNSTFVNFSFVGSGWNPSGGDVAYSYSQQDTKAAAFETQNGESITLLYNPKCSNAPIVKKDTDWFYSQALMCANFIYDLNGSKGPNTVGKDIGFISALYNTETNIVAPVPLAADAGSFVQAEANAACTAQDIDSRIPNIDELSAMFYNKSLLGIDSGWYWSGSVYSVSKAWRQYFETGMRALNTRDSCSVRCIKR